MPLRRGIRLLPLCKAAKPQALALEPCNNIENPLSAAESTRAAACGARSTLEELAAAAPGRAASAAEPCAAVCQGQSAGAAAAARGNP